MKKKITALALVLAVALTGCDDVRSGNKNVGDCGTENASNNCVTTVMYNGKPLKCVTWSGSHSEIGLSCDFVQYWGLNTNKSVETPEGF